MSNAERKIQTPVTCVTLLGAVPARDACRVLIERHESHWIDSSFILPSLESVKPSPAYLVVGSNKKHWSLAFSWLSVRKGVERQSQISRDRGR